MTSLKKKWVIYVVPFKSKFINFYTKYFIWNITSLKSCRKEKKIKLCPKTPIYWTSSQNRIQILCITLLSTVSNPCTIKIDVLRKCFLKKIIYMSEVNN